MNNRSYYYSKGIYSGGVYSTDSSGSSSGGVSQEEFKQLSDTVRRINSDQQVMSNELNLVKVELGNIETEIDSYVMGTGVYTEASDYAYICNYSNLIAAFKPVATTTDSPVYLNPNVNNPLVARHLTVYNFPDGFEQGTISSALQTTNSYLSLNDSSMMIHNNSINADMNISSSGLMYSTPGEISGTRSIVQLQPNTIKFYDTTGTTEVAGTTITNKSILTEKINSDEAEHLVASIFNDDSDKRTQLDYSNINYQTNNGTSWSTKAYIKFDDTDNSIILGPNVKQTHRDSTLTSNGEEFIISDATTTNTIKANSIKLKQGTDEITITPSSLTAKTDISGGTYTTSLKGNYISTPIIYTPKISSTSNETNEAAIKFTSGPTGTTDKGTITFIASSINFGDAAVEVDNMAPDILTTKHIVSSTDTAIRSEIELNDGSGSTRGNILITAPIVEHTGTVLTQRVASSTSSIVNNAIVDLLPSSSSASPAIIDTNNADVIISSISSSTNSTTKSNISLTDGTGTDRGNISVDANKVEFSNDISASSVITPVIQSSAASIPAIMELTNGSTGVNPTFSFNGPIITHKISSSSLSSVSGAHIDLSTGPPAYINMDSADVVAPTIVSSTNTSTQSKIELTDKSGSTTKSKISLNAESIDFNNADTLNLTLSLSNIITTSVSSSTNTSTRAKIDLADSTSTDPPTISMTNQEFKVSSNDGTTTTTTTLNGEEVRIQQGTSYSSVQPGYITSDRISAYTSVVAKAGSSSTKESSLGQGEVNITDTTNSPTLSLTNSSGTVNLTTDSNNSSGKFITREEAYPAPVFGIILPSGALPPTFIQSLYPTVESVGELPLLDIQSGSYVLQPSGFILWKVSST